jgi:hypothetical protein
MPAYNYQCADCGARDLRIAGLDDHVAFCVKCKGLMLRTDDELFAPYFEECDRRPPLPPTAP